MYQQLNIYDLIISVIFSLFYVSIFYLQKMKDSSHYFGFSEIVYGFKTSITLGDFLIRAFYIFAFSVAVYLLINSLEVVVFSVFLGSFLLVWPKIIAPDHIDYRMVKMRKLLLIIYFIFIFLSIVISYMGVLFVRIIAPLLFEYFERYSKPAEIFDLMISVLVSLVLSFIFMKLLEILKRKLNEEINFDIGSSSDKDAKD